MASTNPVLAAAGTAAGKPVSVVGPDSEQLNLAEDTQRLADIGDLILDGHACLEDFDLTEFELTFLHGYLDSVK